MWCGEQDGHSIDHRTMDIMPTPWRLLFRVFGLSPRGNGKDRYFTVIGLFVLFSYTAFLVWYFWNHQFHGVSGIIVCLFFISTFSMLTYNYNYPEMYLKFETNLKKVDRELRDICEAEYEPSKISPTIVLWSMYQCILPLVNLFFLPLSAVFRVLIGYVIMNITTVQQAILVNLVDNRFSSLNDRLARTVIGSDTPSILDRAFRTHSTLHALVADINTHYGFNNLVIVTTTFINWTQNMYSILLVISGEDDPDYHVKQYRLLLAAGFFILQVLVCHSCSQTANHTVLLAHRLLQDDTDISIWDQVRLFSSLLTDNKVHFTVFGIFTLDRKLLTKMTLTTLSYLIIAIQLKDVEIFGEGNEHSNVTARTSSTT